MPDNSRKNNFNALRAIAAFLVLAGHGYILSTGGAPPSIWSHQIQAIGVYILFILGGYLIAISWASDPSIIKYTIKRLSRIWPPLIVLILITVLIVGPIVTEVSLSDYFSNCFSYLDNIIFKPVYNLPGTFMHNPYPNAVNGSLWTIPIELLFYALVPLIMVSILRKKESRSQDIVYVLTIIIVMIVNCYTLYEDLHFGFYGSDWINGFHLLPLYLMGILYTREWTKKYLSLPVSIVLIFVLCTVSLPYPLINALVIIVLPYIVFSFAFAPSKLNGFSKKYEITYGVYLYGFLIQQIMMNYIISWNYSMDPLLFVILSTLLTIPAGYFSCIFIEKPIRECTTKLLKKICPSNDH